MPKPCLIKKKGSPCRQPKRRKQTKPTPEQERAWELNQALYRKFFPWWLKLSEGRILVIFRDGTYRMSPKTHSGSEAFHREVAARKDVLQILWSGMSSDNLTQFVNHVVHSCSPKDIRRLLRESSAAALRCIVADRRRMFQKYVLFSSKDYVLRRRDS